MCLCEMQRNLQRLHGELVLEWESSALGAGLPRARRGSPDPGARQALPGITGHAPAARNRQRVRRNHSLVWGSDYPHAEGTFRASQKLIESLFVGVPDGDRAAMLGGTLGELLGFEAPVAAA